jgi:hypothetical protein
MWFSTLYALSYFLQLRPLQHLFNGSVIKITQHVGIAGTAGLDVPSRIDMQASPRSGTKEIAHVFIYVRADWFGNLGQLHQLTLAAP